MDETFDTGEFPTLGPEDQAAFDAWLSGEPVDGGRAARLEALLGLLGTPVASESGDRSLIDLTYMSVIRAGEAAGDEPELSATSADALDAWVQSGFDAGRAPSVLREHAIRHQRLAAVATAPVPGERRGREALIEATLAGVQSAIDAEADRMAIESRRSFGGRLRLADIVSIAAMLLLATAVVLPVLGSMREGQRRTVCQSNLAGVGGALGMYALSNNSQLPMATAGLGPTWMDVGTTPERSNSANLYMLVRTNMVPLESLACPGNPAAPTTRLAGDQKDWRELREVSYSYRVMPASQRVDWKIAGSGVIADRSPVIVRVARGEPFYPESNSPNHAQEGQHLLGRDGSAAWKTSPVVDGDNIWLPRGIEDQIRDARRVRGVIKGDERPAGAADVFLAP